MSRLKNKVKPGALMIKYKNGKENNSYDPYGKVFYEKVLYSGPRTGPNIREEAEKFSKEVEKQTGWIDSKNSVRDEEGNMYFLFERPLQADEVERIYQFYSEESIQEIPVWVGFVHDTKYGTEEQKQKMDRCEELGYSGTSMTVNEVQQQFNPEWLGYAMIGAKKEYHGQLAEIIGYDPQPYNVVDTDRVPVVMNNPLTFRVDVERLPELITGTIVTMVEYDKTKIGTKESFEDFPISEKTYYFDLNDVDMEAYEALKDYIRIELEEE